MRKSPMRRARHFLLWLAKEPGWYVVLNGMIVLSDQAQEKLAEVIAEAEDELRDGFMKKPRGREQIIHD